MADVVNAQAIDLIALYITGNAPPDPVIEFGLFVTTATITCETVIGDLTECTAPGYSRQSASAGGWTGSTSTCVATYTHPDLTFSMTGPGSPGQTIYGHFAWDSANSVLLWVQLWASTFVLPSGSSAVILSPSWSDEECT